jgi:hypothetical protein
MKNFGIDLNENAQGERKEKKIDKTNTKKKAEWEKFLIDNMDDEVVLEMHIDDYLKGIDYKIPSNKNFKNKSKKLKQLYYYKWQGVEDVLKTITDLYRKQDTPFKFNISMAYLLKRPLWSKEDEKGQRKQIGYEYNIFQLNITTDCLSILKQ